MFVCVCVCVCVYIYIGVFVCRDIGDGILGSFVMGNVKMFEDG